MNEQPDQKPEIPARLLDGLKNIESSGAMPMLIPQVLESFLTEQGVYSSSMTPVDAWEALRRVRDGEEQQVAPAPPPSPETDVPAQLPPDATSVQSSTPAPAIPPATKSASPLSPFRRKGKKYNR